MEDRTRWQKTGIKVEDVETSPLHLGTWMYARVCQRLTAVLQKRLWRNMGECQSTQVGYTAGLAACKSFWVFDMVFLERRFWMGNIQAPEGCLRK